VKNQQTNTADRRSASAVDQLGRPAIGMTKVDGSGTMKAG
jgi:hypothetical protein